MYRLESIQRRATKFIPQDHESSYSNRLFSSLLSNPAINQPVQVLVTFYVQIYAEHFF